MTVAVVTAVREVHTVVSRWQAAGQLLDEEVVATRLLAQSTLQVLQLTQEVEVWGNGGPALFHKPYKGTERMWVIVASISHVTLSLGGTLQ